MKVIDLVKNIAIFLGVREYQNLDNLPCATNDVQLIKDTLHLGGNFQELIVIEPKGAQLVNEELEQIVCRIKDEKIDQIFFYFSGHGECSDEKSYLLMNDYSPRRRESTSLNLDTLLKLFRRLNPKVAVMVVDACYSGMRFIKSPNIKVNIESDSGQTSQLSSLVFMFSSQQNQPSYADKDISDFTYRFVEAVGNSKTENVRYSYIKNCVVDAFEEGDQTPNFLEQGPSNEILGMFSEMSRTKIRGKLNKFETNKCASINETIELFGAEIIAQEVENSVQNSKISNDVIINVAPRNYEKEYASTQMSEIEHLFGKYSIDPTLMEHFEVSREWYDNYSKLPGGEFLARWLDKHSNEKFFASTNKYVEEYRDIDSNILAADLAGISHFFGNYQKKKRTKYLGWETTIKGMPFLALEVVLTPKRSSGTRYSAWFTYLISRSQLTYFSAFVTHKEVTWGEYEIELMSNWLVHDSAPDLGKLNEWEESIQRFYQAYSDWVAKREMTL